MHPILANPYVYPFWLEYQLDPSRSDYNMVFEQKIQGQLDPARLSQAIHRFVAESFLFNCRLVEQKQQLFWQPDVAISAMEIFNTTEQAENFVTAPFNLEMGPLYRFGLFTINNDTHRFILVAHHVLLDGLKRNSLLTCLEQYYNHADFKQCSWQEQQTKLSNAAQQYRQGYSFTEAEQYWKNYLTNAPENNTLPYNKQPSAQGTQTIAFNIAKSQVKPTETSNFNFLLLSWAVLMARYCNQKKVSIGYPISVQKKAEYYFGVEVNSLIAAIDTSNNPSFKTLVEQFQTHVKTIKENHFAQLPIHKILSISDIKNPNISFAQSELNDHALQLAGCSSQVEHHFGLATGNSDLGLHYQEMEEKFEFLLIYNTHSFTQQQMQRLADHYATFVKNLSLTDNINVDFLSQHEKRELLYINSETATAFDRNLTLPLLFSRSVAKNPDGIALKFKDKTMTYRQLDEKSNQLAHCIDKIYQGEQSSDSLENVLIALCVDRSFDTIIGILGILKSGAAYVPIDAETPQQRIDFILQDTQAKLVITQQQLQQKFSAVKHTIIIDTIPEKTTARKALQINLRPEDLAYVIYTSGTTGRPKGVMVTHLNVVNFIYGTLAISDYIACLHTTLAMQTSISFDPSVEEIWLAFSLAKSLWIVDTNSLLSPKLYQQGLQANNVDIIIGIPSWLEQMKLSLPQSISLLNIGGEPLPLSLAMNYINKTNITNSYGPTETTISITFKYFAKGCTISKITLGKAMQNIKLYVLSDDLQLMPIGAPGELYVSGLGLAKGYLNQPELTQQVFIRNPFSNHADYQTIYKTGDYVRWLANGELEYLGRKDQQVKISGYRIELDEIKTNLLAIESITQCIVIVADHNSEKYIIAYYISNKQLDEQQLKRVLKQKLPHYMVPHRVMAISEIPMTINQKLDKARLPSPFAIEQHTHTGGTVDTLKQKLLALWQDILPYQKIGYQDKFFEVGGTSLLAIKFCALLADNYDIELSIADFFQNPCIDDLAEFLTTNNKTVAADVKPTTQAKRDIAIIGLAVRTTNANNQTEFWQNLVDGVESIIDFSEQELRAEGISETLLSDKNYIKRSGFIRNFKQFDAGFFNITPNEALATDPQHRHLYECVWEALEDAGINPDHTSYKIGFYASQAKSKYYQQHIQPNADLQTGLGEYQIGLLNSADFLTTKISYKLGLTGPSLNIQTGCSSSLVAVDTAINHLRAGKCDIAIAGGVRFKGKKGYLYQPGMINSQDGHCRAFDKNASGTLSGEAVGIVILKPLDLARQDNDNIYAVIKGSATNNDAARKVGYTAPSVNGQAEVIQLALQDANVNATSISYVEAHGTGTLLGDPIEIAALNQAYRQQTDKKHYCAIASLKNNIGHTDSAAGIMGLIKTALALRHKKIPANINFTQTNPNIDFANSPFYVNDKLQDWSCQPNSKRYAAVSSFGIGGTNAHVVLEEAPQINQQHNDESLHLLPLSARTEPALQQLQQKLATFIIQNPQLSLSDIAYTLQCGRKDFEYRNFIIASTTENAVEQLNRISKPTSVDAAAMPKVVFMFPGQGTQYINMAKQLYDEQPVFRNVVNRAADYLLKQKNIDLIGLLYPESATEQNQLRLQQTQYAQPALFVIEYALAETLMAWGIKPDLVIGHSLGEYVAATVAKVFSFEDALHLISERGRLMQEAPTGKMLAIAESHDVLNDILPKTTAIAAINCQNSCVISGDHHNIDALQTTLVSRDITHHLLATSHAFHSPMMQSSAIAFNEILSSVPKHSPEIPLIANLTGKFETQKLLEDDYWSQHILSPVLFHQSMATLLTEENICCIEVGPGDTLSTLALRNCKPDKLPTIINCLADNKPTSQTDNENLLAAMGKLWQANVKPDWQKLSDFQHAQKISLPTYCFQHKEYWVPKAKIHQNSPISEDYHDYFYRPIWKSAHHITQFDAPIQHDDETAVIFTNKNIMPYLSPALSMKNKLIVLPGKAFATIGKNKYRLNFADKNALLTFFEQHKNSNIKQIIYAHRSCPLKQSRLEQTSMQVLFLELLTLCQAIAEHFSHNAMTMTVLTNQLYSLSGEHTRPQLSMVLGPVKVLPQEHPNFNCRLLDIELQPEQKMSRKLVEMLRSDLTHPLFANEIVYRHNQRWIRDYEAIENLPKTKPSQFSKVAKPVFLITGGLGGIGLSYAEHLSTTTPEATLILLTRRKLAAKTQWQKLSQKDNEHKALYQQLLAIDKRIKKLIVYSADLANKEQCKQLFTKIKQIDYVLHSAGVPAGCIITLKTPEMVEKTFSPKLAGTLNLTEQLKSYDIKHLLLCSSLNAITGGRSQIDYVSANAFLDRYADYLNQKTGIKTTSINWLRWNKVGMAETTDVPLVLQQKRQQARQFGVEPHIGSLMIDSILTMDETQVVTSKRKIAELLTKNKQDQTTNEPVTIKQQELPIIEQVRLIWQTSFGLEKVNDNDDFFALGGHSLLAIQVAHKMSVILGKEIRIQDIFTHRTLAGIVNCTRNTTLNITPFTERNAPLSFAQTRLYFLQCYEPTNTAYHITYLWQLSDDCHRNALEKSLQAIVKKHSVLRTMIKKDKHGNPVQLVHSSPLTIERLNLNLEELPTLNNKPFQLNDEYPIRVSFIETNDKQYYCSVIIHHIAFDGWSANIFMHELAVFYYHYANNSPLTLHENTLQYRDFAAWQKNYLTGETLKNHMEYWRRTLANITPLVLPIDKPRPSKIDYRGDRCTITLDKGLCNKLSQLAQQHKVTTFTILLSGFYILLHKYTQQDDIVIGTPIANRQYHQLHKMIGFFVNTLILRAIFNDELTISQLIENTKQYLQNAQTHQDLPFEKLLDELHIERHQDKHPLFQVLFSVVQKQEETTTLPLQRIQGAYKHKVAQFDLSVTVHLDPMQWLVSFNYACALFEEKTISQMLNHYLTILTKMTEHSQQPVCKIRLLSDLEYNTIVHQWNQTNIPIDQNLALPQLFAASVARSPDTIALVCDDKTMNYLELDNKSNQLAHYLQVYSQPGDIIALCLSPSFDMLIAVLAVLKAGCAYLPLAPDYPDQRITLLLKDSDAACLLTTTEYIERLQPLSNAHCVQLDTKPYQHESSTPLATQPMPDDLAYIIYTSGTTGQPKGVMVDHSALTFYLQSFAKSMPAGQPIISALTVSYCFDVSIPCLFNPLLSGGQVVITKPFNQINFDQYVQYLQINLVNFLMITPSFLTLLQPHLQDFPLPLCIIAAGEKLNLPCINKLILNKNLSVYNLYGPTENVVGSTYFKINTPLNRQIIGRAYDGKRLYILDKHFNPVPKHVIGQLYIGGMGLANGYLHQTELTADRFIQNPFVEQEKFYKTGDLARWQDDGTIEFIDRNDHQIKLHGYRIELDEITQKLSQYPTIDQCLVQLIAHNNQSYLVGYYTANKMLEVTVLQNFLHHELPDYMVPNHYVFLPSFPLTNNGKLDTAALPQPTFTENKYIAPQNKTQQLLCRLWQDALNVEHVGIEDDFFALGGHSLLAIQVAHKMSYQTEMTITVADIFKYKTINNILKQTLASEQQIIQRHPIGDKIHLNDDQTYLWRYECQYPGTADSQVTSVYQLAPTVQQQPFIRAIQAVVKRHASLRTTIEVDSMKQSYQRIHDKSLAINTLQCTENELDAIISAEKLMPFDLSKQLPMRATLISTSSTQYAVFVMHHIAYDEWSHTVFMRDLTQYYAHFTQQKKMPDELPFQYSDYTQWQRTQLTKPVTEQAKQFWLSKLHNYQVLQIPVDKPVRASSKLTSAYVKAILSKSLTKKVSEYCKQAKVSMYTFLLSAYYLLLRELCQQDKILIGTMIANRPYAGMEDQIGYYACPALLITDIGRHNTLPKLLTDTHAHLAQLQKYQYYPIYKITEHLGLDNSIRQRELYNATFYFHESWPTTTKTELLQPCSLGAVPTIAKYRLSLFTTFNGEDIQLKLRYVKSLYYHKTMQRLLRRYVAIVKQLLADPEQPL